MNDLIERLEQAAEGSRELDAEIFFVLHPDYPTGAPVSIPPYGVFLRTCGSDADLPHYTASLDAALTLVPEGWGWLTGNGESWVWPDGGMSRGYRISAATPALALCIAALRARQ